MMTQHLREPRGQLERRAPAWRGVRRFLRAGPEAAAPILALSLQTPMTFAAIPMISAQDREHRIAKRELRLGQIASNEVLLFNRDRVGAKIHLGEQQTGAAVKQKARRLFGRNRARVQMMF